MITKRMKIIPKRMGSFILKKPIKGVTYFLINFAFQTPKIKLKFTYNNVMDSKRQLKVARLIQKEMSQLFISNLRELVQGEMVTVSYVKMTPDLREARIYLSFMLKKDYQPLMDNLNANLSKVRGALGRNLGKSMRVIPSIEFYYDDTFDYTDKMNAILDDLNIPKKDDKKD